MLCTIFDISYHYGVIAASLICSVEKVLCRLTEDFFFGGVAETHILGVTCDL